MANFRKIGGVITVDVDSLLVDLYSILKTSNVLERRVILDIIEKIQATRERAERNL